MGGGDQFIWTWQKNPVFDFQEVKVVQRLETRGDVDDLTEKLELIRMLLPVRVVRTMVPGDIFPLVQQKDA